MIRRIISFILAAVMVLSMPMSAFAEGEDLSVVTGDCSTTGHTGGNATCQAKAVCEVCNQEYGDLAEHTWADITCTTPKTCTVCDAKDGEALGHTAAVDEAVAATCTTAGLTAGSHCSVCNEVLTAQTEVAALGHSYVDGNCSVCGEADNSGAMDGKANEQKISVVNQEQLEAVVLSMPQTLTAGQSLTVSWNEVENASGYWVYITDADGNQIEEAYPSETTYTFKTVLGAGTYTVRVSAQSSIYIQSAATAQVTVTGELAAAPSLTLDKQQYTSGEQITYTIASENAQQLRLHWYGTTEEGYNYDTSSDITPSGVTTTYSDYFYSAGNFQVACSALVNGIWSAYSVPVAFQVAYIGSLDAPVVQMEDSFAAGSEITVSWDTVNNAEYYNVFVYDASNKCVDSLYADAPTTSLKLNAVLAEGTYTVRVAAYADGWKIGESEKKSFSVTGTLAEGPSFTVNANEVVSGKSLTFTVSMECATSFRLSCDNSVTTHEATNGATTFTRNFYGTPGEVLQAKISACVNGVWTDYGPAQDITIIDKPTLAKPVVIIPKTVRAGEDITLSWNAVENAESYRLQVNTAASEGVWYDYLEKDELFSTIPAGKLIQGEYLVTLTASDSDYDYQPGVSDPTELAVQAPMPGNEYRYSTRSDGTAYLSRYLGIPVEIIIPDTIGGGTVTDISSGCFQNNGTLTKVTIPASVTYISDTAFEGAVSLTICGYSGSEAEEYALLHGYTFEALDNGEGAISAAWDSQILINKEATFTITAAGATDVRMYVNGYGYSYTEELTAQGATVTWTPTETGSKVIRFEALVGGSWLTTKNYVVEVGTLGPMPQAQNLTVTPAEIEPREEVVLRWEAPADVEKPQYRVGLQEPSDTKPGWYYVNEGALYFTLDSYDTTAEGTYTLWVKVMGQAGFEESVSAPVTFEVKSTKLWDYDGNEVFGYHGTDKDITIPSQIDGSTITTVGRDIFKDSDITSVIIPEEITQIRDNAFINCGSLGLVSLPDTLYSIGGSVFKGCTSLSSIALPDELTYLGGAAFSGCTSLSAVTIPENIDSIYSQTFYGCTSLSQVTLPDGLSSIGWWAFYNCTSLKSIIIPQSVTAIDSGAFTGCTSLTISGYTGSRAESFAKEKGFTFVALDEASAGNISFTLAKNMVYARGYLEVTITAPDAEALRLHVNEDTYSASATTKHSLYTPGTYEISVSQQVNGQWLIPCESQTVTVVALEAPVIEPIADTPAYSPVTIRWKNVEDAVRYSLRLYENNVQVHYNNKITDVGTDGYVSYTLPAEALVHEGTYEIFLTAYAADQGESTTQATFQTTDINDVFLYEKVSGGAKITDYTGGAEDVSVPAELDGYPVIAIGADAFQNTTAVSVTLPSSVTSVETGAFSHSSTLKTITISEATAALNAGFFQNCAALTSVTLGPGIFAKQGAFSGCTPNTVIYGYSGGNVEEEAGADFSSLGILAAGPAIEAEDVLDTETLHYTITQQDATAYYIQEISPDGSVSSKTVNAFSAQGQMTFKDLTQDSIVVIKGSALVNGAWTAYSQKEVKVSIARELDKPVIHAIAEPLARHLEHTITWDPVDNAKRYQITIQNGSDTIEETVETTSFTIEPGAMQISDSSTVSVTAMAEGYRDATSEASFQVVSLKLDTPEITVAQKIPRHLGAEISWNQISSAQWYTVTVTCGSKTIRDAVRVEDLELTLAPKDLEPGSYTASVIAGAEYCTDSDTVQAEFEVFEEALAQPQITAPQTIIGGEDFQVKWQGGENTETYTVEVLSEDGTTLITRDYPGTEQQCAIRLDAYLTDDTVTVKITAQAEYRKESSAAQEIQYKPLYSYEISGGNAVITGYNGSETTLYVPGSINGNTVVAIGDGAFEGNTAIVGVNLATSITSIGAKAFKDCTALSWITGEGVKTIGDAAFYNCTSLTSVRFHCDAVISGNSANVFYNTPYINASDPDGLLDIELSQVKDYSGSLNLGSIVYQEGVTEIPARTHYNNLRLASVYLPKSLLTIGSEAFGTCPQLQNVKVYDGVTSVADDAFSNSPNTHLYIHTLDMEKVSYIEQYAIDHQIPFTKVFCGESDTENSPMYLRYPDGTKRVFEKDQYENIRLVFVYLPESVETVESKAFAQCGALSEVVLYDGITSIADDAFEGSDDVCFTLYVKDLNQVSYVEQYAIDHGISYNKYGPAPETDDAFDLRGDGIAVPSRVEVDIPTAISIKDIPSDADRLVVYLDGQEIYGTALDGSENGTTAFAHTFRSFGDHTLTAEAFKDGQVIKFSWVKPVTVVGIRLTADRASAWTGETVTFTVESYPEESAVNLYAEELCFGEIALNGGAGTLSYAFTQAGDRKITARVPGGLTSRVLTLPILCVGQLDKPQLEAEAVQILSDGLVCSWNTTDHTDGYVLRVRTTSGKKIAVKTIQDNGTARMSCTIPAAELPGEGIYYLYLMNYGYKYDQNESDTLSVQMVGQDALMFTMDKVTVPTCEPVNFTFLAPGATKVKLWADGDAIETIDLTNGRGSLSRAFTQSGERKLSIRAWRDNAWTEFSLEQILTVTSAGKLDAVTVTAASPQLLGDNITASWTAVENADGYKVYFRDASSNTIHTLDTDQRSIQVPANLLTAVGDYYFMVVAYGAGYDQNEGRANVAVAEHLPGPVILTPTENQTLTALTTELTWRAVSGAESYVVSLAKKNVDGVFEKVWTANDTVNVGISLSYDLTDLVYGGEYRVAVGSVATLADGTERIGWSERLFRVEMPELTVDLTADAVTPNEGQQLTLTATVNHPMTQAVLTDETGAAVNTISAISEEKNGSRIFTFLLTETKQGEKTYTVTVTGTGALKDVTPVTDSLKVQWLDANAPAVKDVTVVPANPWPNKKAVFTITANIHTVKLDVYWIGDTVELVETITPVSSDAETAIFQYERTFPAEGDYKMRFVPVNADDEWVTGKYYTCTVVPMGKLPAPEVTNLSSGDILLQQNHTVQWEPVVLGEDMAFGGYCVTIRSWDVATNDWKVMPDHRNQFTGTKCEYPLPTMKEGEAYRIEVYTVEEGKTEPSENSGCTAIDFSYRTVPDFKLTAIESDGILNKPVTVRWTAPVWKRDTEMKPDSYVVYWYCWDSAQGKAVQVHSEVLTGDAVSAILPGNLVTETGNYTVDVYALLGTAQKVCSGNNAFTISPPEVTITKPKDTFAWLSKTPLAVQGTIKGGVTQVLVRLLDPSGKPLEMKDAAGAKVKEIPATVEKDAFTAKLDLVNPLVAGQTQAGQYTLQAFGFLEDQKLDITKYADSDEWKFSVSKPEIIEFSIEGSDDVYWLFENQTMTAEVTANKAVTTVAIGLHNQKIAETKVTEDKGDSHVFTSSGFSIQTQGKYNVTAYDPNHTEASKSLDVYVVKHTAEKNVCVKSATTLYSSPENRGQGRSAVTPETALLQIGICGDYVLVKVTGKTGELRFVHKDNLVEADYEILNPYDGASIDIENMDELLVEWEANPEAVSYKVILRVTFMNRADSLVSVEIPQDVAATQDDVQRTVFKTQDILAKITNRRSFKDTTWEAEISIEAYGK